MEGQFGLGSWKKKKGVARISLPSGTTGLAEIHGYEAHGMSKVTMKIRRWS